MQPGITTRHCFSAGVHYDPVNTAFGALVALDEHLVAPGTGFARHPHRRVEILSWVLAGTLRHEDAAGRVELVRPGTVLHQTAGSGIEHVEGNASDAELLRFVQLILRSDATAAGQLLGTPPVEAAGGQFSVLAQANGAELVAASFMHAYVAQGSVRVAGHDLSAGDSVRIRDAAAIVEGDGGVLVWRSGDRTPSSTSSLPVVHR